MSNNVPTGMSAMRFLPPPLDYEYVLLGLPPERCRPLEPRLAEQHAEAVAKACRLIEAAEELPDLEALAEAAGMSRFHFHRVFKAMTGITPKAYAAAHRARRVREGLRGATP